MLSLSIVEEIDRLLREGELSQRKIAARLGVSRGTVGAISNGRRGIYGKEATSDDNPLEPQGPPERCSRCGFSVYMPCLICRTRDYRARQARLQTAAAMDASQRRPCDLGPQRPTLPPADFHRSTSSAA